MVVVTGHSRVQTSSTSSANGKRLGDKMSGSKQTGVMQWSFPPNPSSRFENFETNASKTKKEDFISGLKGNFWPPIKGWD